MKATESQERARCRSSLSFWRHWQQMLRGQTARLAAWSPWGVIPPWCALYCTAGKPAWRHCGAARCTWCRSRRPAFPNWCPHGADAHPKEADLFDHQDRQLASGKQQAWPRGPWCVGQGVRRGGSEVVQNEGFCHPAPAARMGGHLHKRAKGSTQEGTRARGLRAMSWGVWG